MTSDKHNVAKPFTPSLSAAFHRSTKSPLTPKLASPNPTLPATRRLAHHDPYSTPSKDDLASAPTLLSANITPRSGSRNTRRDGTNTSPSNTPSRATSPQTTYSQPIYATGTYRSERSPGRAPVKAEQPRSLRAKTLTAEEQQSSRPSSFSDISSASRMFFHASDASRPPIASDVDATRSQPAGKVSPSSSFFYANGDEERQSPIDETNYTTSVAKRRSGGLPRTIPSSKPGPSPSPWSKSPKLPSSASPAEDARSYLSSTPDHVLEKVAHLYNSPPSITADTPQPSIGRRHSKSYSVDTTTRPPDSLRASPIIVSPSTFCADGMTPVMSDQIPTLRPRIFSNGSSASTEPLSPVPQSPSKSEGPGAPANDMALNARTERKILDLEISNSSLLAINRTLEREMRKQNAELRRYRRLSRSGRISMAPSIRSVSGTALSVTSEVDEGSSELSSVRSQDESEFSDEDSVPDEGVMSPGSLAEHDAKHRAQDEKRLLLDVARHQELLVDSQKMNQSLKRCLGWTEELIKEGRRALEYNVHVQDIELGGRVLSPDELGELGESTQGLLSPSTEFSSVFPSPEIPFDAPDATDAPDQPTEPAECTESTATT
ncbi:hypothetical protein N7510_010437 [Penicillium lagena]|uniref:uncharacterized protein n=1 Tax=Penicillium lagena TaxID=94218 RepID=UPI00253FF4A3|nr:uncharacterized protein N7510_010437 [Penicillium lagena]KAJ5605283.1 hypothetical protein N7510_010437 [Penicillium lagena]